MIMLNCFREVEADILEFEKDMKTFEKSELLKKMKLKLTIVKEEMTLAVLPKL
jgi:hypothetical protein